MSKLEIKTWTVRVTYGKGKCSFKSRQEAKDKPTALSMAIDANPFAFLKANNITVIEHPHTK